MEKDVYNEQNGLWYGCRTIIILLAWSLPAEKEEQHIGVLGQRHLRYIRQYIKVFYTHLLTSGKLQTYLADIEEQAPDIV